MTTKVELLPGGEGGHRTLKVTGDVDMDTSPSLKEQVLKALKGAKSLRVNLAGVGYLDSSGIAVLIQGLKEAQKAKAEFVLQAPSAQVMSVIKLAMLHSIFRIEPSGAS